MNQPISQSSTANAGAKPGGSVKIGLLHSLSGTMMVSEQPLLDTERMAIDEINRAGGVLGCQIEPLIADGASAPERFAEAARNLLAGGAKALFGCWTSASRKAVRPVVEAADNLLWYPVQYEGLEESPYICYTGGCLNQQIMPLVEWALAKFGHRVFLVGSDYIFPRTVNHLIQSLVTDRGGSVVGEHYVELGEQDFSGIIAAVKQTQPDVVINTINGDSNQAFYRQYRAARLLPDEFPIIATSVTETELESVVAAAAGHFACWDYFQSLDTPTNREFVSRFKNRFGAQRVVSAPATKAYMQIYLWKQTVERAGTFEPSTVRRSMAETAWDSPIGLTRIEANQHLSIPVRIGRLKPDGQFEIVWSHDEPIAPLPWLGLEGVSFPAKSMLKNALTSFTDGIDHVWRLKQEITQRQLLEAALQKANVGLEEKVAERTVQLEQTVSSLQKEIKSHEEAEVKLGKSRMAALNMMEDAVEARRLAEQRSVALQSELAARQRAQAELVWKTAFLEAQVDSALDGILVVNENAKKILQNDRLLKLFKVPEEIARDDDDTKLLEHVAGRTINPKQFGERVAHLYAHRDEIGREEIELQDRTILDRYSAPVTDKSGKYYGRIWTFRDITAHRRVEEQYRQAQKMEAIGTLAGGIAHDFNNILSAVIGYTELAKRRVAGDPAAGKYLDSVLQAGDRAVGLVRQILTFSRTREQGQERAPIELRLVVAEPLKLLQATIPANIEFDVSLPTGLPAVLADATQIHQIVMNLCTNASHAMKDRPGRLGVKLEKFTVDHLLAEANPGLRPGPYVRLSISDTGHGMSEATKARIFEPFFTTKGPGEGTGLGLSVVHGIMQSHEGAITVYSQPGEGTVFHLYFPAIAAKAQEAAATATEIPTGQGEVILLVDDEKQLASLGQNMLEELGYVVESKTNVTEAFEVFRANPSAFDLVITDLTMPGMLGTDFAAQLLQLQPDLPIILITGYSATLTEQKVRELGIRELLLKPLTLESLGLVVHRVLSTPAES